MSDWKLTWNGKKVFGSMAEASIIGVNDTMAQAVNHAKRNHEWQNRTGTLEGSISIAEWAQRMGRGVRGLWGSKDVVYALIHELGGRNIKARPYLRPAADAQYPTLGANIKKAYARL